MYSWYLNHRKSIWLLLLVALYLIAPAIFFWLLGWTVRLAPLLLVLVLQIGGLILFLAKSGVKCLYPEEIDITFANVKGLGDTLDDLKQIVQIINDNKSFRELGGRMVKGILLSGPPGTGKTLTAKAIAGEVKVPVILATGGTFIQMFLGVGILKVYMLYKKAKRLSQQYGACIVFIDEIDAIGGTRGPVVQTFAGMDREPIIMGGFAGGGGMGTLNQLLKEIDGIDTPSTVARWCWRTFKIGKLHLLPRPKQPNYNVVTIGATNTPEVLDPALTRKGRLGRHFLFTYPTLEGRIELFNYYLNEHPTVIGRKKVYGVKHKDIDVRWIAQLTHRHSGSDIAEIVSEALLIALKAGRDYVTNEDLYKAFKANLVGTAVKRTYSQETRERLAHHESAHAFVCAKLLPDHLILAATLEGTADAYGLLVHVPVDEYKLMDWREIHHRVMVSLAGRAVEEIVYGVPSMGATSDLAKCTYFVVNALAYGGYGRRMVSPAEYLSKNGYGSKSLYWEYKEEADGIVQELYQKTKNFLLEGRHLTQVKMIAQALQDKTTLSGDEVLRIIEESEVGVGQEVEQEQEKRPERKEALSPAQAAAASTKANAASTDSKS